MRYSIKTRKAIDTGCFMKVKFKSARRAKEAARRIEGRAWYLCKKCKFYHVGSNNI